MLISKEQLIELAACRSGLFRFIRQTGDTTDAVEVTSLIGGENTVSDLLWLAGKTLPKEKIVKFACDCALLNIDLIKPYTDKFEIICGFLKAPESVADADVADAAVAAAAAAATAAAYARAAEAAEAAAYARAAYAAAYAAYATAVADAVDASVDVAADAVVDASTYATAAATTAATAAATAAADAVDKLLIQLFS